MPGSVASYVEQGVKRCLRLLTGFPSSLHLIPGISVGLLNGSPSVKGFQVASFKGGCARVGSIPSKKQAPSTLAGAPLLRLRRDAWSHLHFISYRTQEPSQTGGCAEAIHDIQEGALDDQLLVAGFDLLLACMFCLLWFHAQ